MKPFLLFSIFILLFASPITSNSFVLAEEQIRAETPEIKVLNEEIAIRKDKIKELETTIESYKKNIIEKQNEGISLKNQISILDNNIGQVQTEIDLTNEKIKQTKLEIDILTININEKVTTMEKQKAVVATMVQSIHADDQRNYLEIMLSYSNFADFYNAAKQLENVYIDLGRSVKILRQTKEDLDARRTQITAKKDAYEQLQQDFLNKKDKLNQQQNYKKRLLIDTKSSEQRFQTLLSSLKQQYRIIENEVGTFEEKVRKKLEEENKIKTSGIYLMRWPVPNRTVNAIFHDPEYPFRNVFQHSGIDIKSSQGTPVIAAASGYVGRAKRCALSSCYSYVLIIHSGSLSTVYGHLSSILAVDDSFVNQGEIIGFSGGTPGTVGAGPFVTGPHLHFEVRLNGIPVDPANYLLQ